MANKPKFYRAAADRAVAELAEHHTKTGDVPRELLEAKALESGYSPRHLQRLMERALAGDPLRNEPDFSVDERVVGAVFLCCGNLAKAHRKLEGFENLPSERHFRRMVGDTLGTDQLAYARRGSIGFRDAQAYLRCDYPHRGHSFLLDHSKLSIWVVPRGSKRAVKPWITTVMDGKSRYVLGYSVTFARPTSEEVRAALMSAFILRFAPDDETIVGGLPMRAVWDRGLEFVSNLVTESCLRLGVMPVALPAYSPHLKGRMERFYRFFKDDCLSHLPGYTGGGTDLRGHSAIANNAIGEDELLARIEGWFDRYLADHRVGGEETPLEAWRRDGAPLREVAPEQLWVDMLIAKTKAKVSKNGIRFDRIDFTAPETTGLVGRHVEIRYLPHDRSFIEVFLGGDHLFTAYPHEALTADDEERLKQHRVDRRRLAQRRATRSNRERVTNHDGEVHKLTTDRSGNRTVADASIDVLDGPPITVDDLAARSTASQGALF